MATARKPSSSSATAPMTEPKSKAKFKVTFTRASNTPARATKTIMAESYSKDGSWITFVDGSATVYEAAIYEVASIERIAAETVDA